MTVRPFNWRDIPALYRYRHESVFLDSALLLTRGPLMLPGAMFSYLAPSMGVFTFVSNEDKSNSCSLVGQFIHLSGSPFAHLTFLAPYAALEASSLSLLMDYMITLLGERGAMRLLADVDDETQAYEALRMSGFAIYSRQRIWSFTGKRTVGSANLNWRVATDQDVIPVRNLYNNLVPGLVQQIEPFQTQRPRGLTYYQDGELLAYVELKSGHRGVWAQPFVHPDMENVESFLQDLIDKISNRQMRPVYLCVRSYQAWLEQAIEDLGAEAGPRQAVMARQLVSAQRIARPFALPALESGQPEITAPYAHIYRVSESVCNRRK